MQNAFNNISPEAPLLEAARAGQWALVKEFLGQGMDVNQTDKYETTPLIAAADEGYIDIVRLLIEEGACIDRKDVYTNTAHEYARIKAKKNPEKYSGIVRLIENAASLEMRLKAREERKKNAAEQLDAAIRGAAVLRQLPSLRKLQF